MTITIAQPIAMAEDQVTSPMAPSLTGVTSTNQGIIAAFSNGVTGITGGGTWSKLISYLWAIEGETIDIWYCASLSAGTVAPSIAATMIPGGGNAAIFSEWNGIAAAGSTGAGTVAGQAGNSTAMTGPNLTPITANSLYFGIGGNFGTGVTPATGDGFTYLPGPSIFTHGAGFLPLAYAVTSAASLNPSWTLAPSGQWSGVGAVFTPTSSSSGGSGGGSAPTVPGPIWDDGGVWDPASSYRFARVRPESRGRYHQLQIRTLPNGQPFLVNVAEFAIRGGKEH